jgi:hypothetical protein
MSSYHPHLDALTAYGHLGFYHPIIRQYVNNPETFIIFPYFFGLHPKNNPGRAGLELFASDCNIQDFRSFCILRVIKVEHNIYDVIDDTCIGSTWTKISHINNLEAIEKIIHNIESFLQMVKFVKSPHRENVWSLGGQTNAEMEYAISLFQFELSQIGYNVYPMLWNNFIPQKRIELCTNTFLLGWGISTLIEAFRFNGIHIQQSLPDIKNQLFQYDKKRKDFEENILPFLQTHEQSDDSCILFFKEPSRSAREELNAEKKIESIVFIDKIVERLLDVFEGKPVNIIVLSDHQSNIGEKKTFPGKTLYYYGNLEKQIMDTQTDKFIISLFHFYSYVTFNSQGS